MKFFSVLSVVFLTLFTGSISYSAPQVDAAVLAGYRINDANSRAKETSVDGQGGFQLGGLALLPFSNTFVFRTGFIYTQRNFETKTSGVTADVEYAHFDVPLTVMYKVSDFGGIFAGAGISLKVQDDCESEDCPGAKSTLVPISFGGHFKVAPQFAVEFYYEMIPGKLDDNLKDTSSVVISALITFE